MGVDFVRWEVCNMPLGWTSSFDTFKGSQPVHLTSYSLKKSTQDGGTHAESNKNVFMTLVCTNNQHSSLQLPNHSPVPGSLEIRPPPAEESSVEIIAGFGIWICG